MTNETFNFIPIKIILTRLSTGRRGRVRKLRHIYTLPGYGLTSSQNQFVVDEIIDTDRTNNRKYFSETNLQNSKNDFHVYGEITKRERHFYCHVDAKENKYNDDDDNGYDINVNDNYQLRRTQKFMNLREELDKQIGSNEYERRVEFDMALAPDRITCNL